MTLYSEPDLILPTLAFLDQEPAGLTTSELIALLTEALRPQGRDAQILAGRRDTYFSQKVRNLLGSHHRLSDLGLATYDRDQHRHVITPAGVAYLEQQRGQLGHADQAMVRRAERSGTRFGDYRLANETPRSRPRQPFEVDPSELDRASGSHARIQNALSAWIVGHGLKPHRWEGGPAQFDIGWFDGDTLFVAEVKSLTDVNETRQLPTGTGPGAPLPGAAAGDRSGCPRRPGGGARTHRRELDRPLRGPWGRARVARDVRRPGWRVGHASMSRQ
jgi:hypothetical protein